MEAAKVTAVVARVVGDVGLAEDLAQDAFVQALEQWPRDGIPHRPGAWLTSTARRRAIDRIRLQRSPSSTCSALQARSPTTTCCRASAGTCSPGSAATTRRAPSSPGPP